MSKLICVKFTVGGNYNSTYDNEATSALDTETAVMEAIDSLHGQKTLIIIAHRLTTIRNCDAIYRIDEGKAVKCKYEDLVSGEGK